MGSLRNAPAISVGGITIDGVEDVLREAGDRVADVFRAGVARAYLEAELVMTEAKQLTPVRDGHLRGSGHVAARNEIGGDVAIDLVFGGQAAAYAIYVHEDLDAFHKVGQAKFLEAPLHAAMPTIRDNVVAAMRLALQKR